MTKLVLHIGMHKTGSTAIQRFLFWNRLWLRPMGLYLPLCRMGLTGIYEKHRDLRVERLPSGGKAFPDVLDSYIRRIDRSRARVAVLSNEVWTGFGPDYPELFAPLRAHFDVEVVCFYRRFDFWTESFYRQQVRQLTFHETKPYRAFLQKMKRRNAGGVERLDRWADVFGADAVRVIPFEPAAPGFDAVKAFVDVLGLNTRRILRSPVARGRANDGLTRDQAEVVRLLRAEGVGLKEANIRTIRKTVKGGNGGYLPDRARDRMMGALAEDMQLICDRYVRDGRTVLFPEVPERFESRDTHWPGLEDDGPLQAARHALGID